MSTGRKSQLEKFEARMGKKHAEDAFIAETKAKAAAKQDIMEKGRNVLKETTGRDDVFAVIARDSMETFIQLWNNSMETVIKETIRTEVRDVIQTEMESAVRGVFAGINGALQDVVSQARTGLTQSNTIDEPVVFDLDSMTPMSVLAERAKLKEEATTGPLSTRIEAEKQLESMPLYKGADRDGDAQLIIMDETIKKPRRKARVKGFSWDDIEVSKNYLFTLLDEAQEQGVNINSGGEFKKLGGKFNTAYQKGLPALYGKSVKGASTNNWKRLIAEYNNR